MPEGILGSNFTSVELLSLVTDWVVFLRSKLIVSYIIPFKVSDITFSIVLFIEDETFAVIELRLSVMFVVVVLLEGTRTGVGVIAKLEL
jgi:hypothetical protein